MRTRSPMLRSTLDVLATVAPIICLVDCIVIPIVLAVLPMVGIQKVYHGINDQLLTLLVLLICAPVLVPGYFRHRKKSVLVFMSLGFSLVFLANFAGHLFDNTVHVVITIAGSCFLIKANQDNKRFSKKCGCTHHLHDKTNATTMHAATDS